MPGPNGLPGGYPVRLENGKLELNLPKAVCETDAIAWNAAFEARKGLTIEGGAARYRGPLRELLAEAGSTHAEGFELADLEGVCKDMIALRDRLMSLPSAN